jgi:urease accessory protein
MGPSTSSTKRTSGPGSRSETVDAVPRPRLLISGSAEIGFRDDAGTTRLAHLYHHDPLRVLFPTPAKGDPTTAVVATTSGGIVGGDRMAVTATAGDDARAMVTMQAAEKVYRSAGPDATVDVRLAAGAGAWLEWLPQETILFEGARLRRTTRVDLAADASVLAGEMIVLGRIARGERMATGLVRDAWEVRREGRLVWADALHVDGDVAGAIDAPAGLGGAVAIATVVLAAPGAPDLRDAVRDLLPAAGAGATVVAGLLLVRLMGPDPAVVRAGFAKVWSELRTAAGGCPAALPRIWHV